MRRSSFIYVWAWLLLLGTWVGDVAWAQDDEGPSVDLAEEADLHFQMGIELYKKARYDDALEHLLLSNRLVPNRNVVFNIGRAYERSDRLAEAYRHYSEYAALEQDQERLALVNRAIERISVDIALVEIRSDPPGATVYVDRRDLGARGRTPQSMALEPGAHTILLDLEGYTSGTAEAELVVGARASVDVELDQILGKVRIDGVPEGAEIRLGDEDSEVLGTLPVTLSLPPGPHVLVATAEGRRTTRQIAQIDTDETTRVVMELPLVTGSLVVDAHARDALVEIDGRAAGFTPAVLDVPIGEHELRVTLTGHHPHEETVRIDADASTTVDIQLRSLREVTAASRQTQSVEDAPASVSLITAEEIRAFGYQDLYDALGGTRGVYQSDDLTYRYLGFRGFSRPGDYGNRVLVTYDGHSMNDDQLGASYVGSDAMTDLRDVDQIEVVRGPGSALYGSNAIFGVINVVNHNGATIEPAHVGLTAEGERTLRGRVGAGVGNENGGLWFSVAGAASQGRDFFFDELAELPRGEGESVGADGFVANTVQGRVWVGDVTVQGFHHGRAKRIPTGAFDTILADPRAVSDDFRSFGEIRYEPSIGENTQLYTRVWLDSYVYRGDFPYGVHYIFSDEWRGTWAGAEPRLVTQATPWLNLTLGAEYRNHFQAKMVSVENRDLVGGRPYGVALDETPTFAVYAGYAVAELSSERVRLTLGARGDFYATSVANFSAFNPRAALVLHPTRNDVVKLVAGTAYRAPSPYEFFYNDEGLDHVTQIPPDSLVPEDIITGEVEYTHSFSDVVTGTVAGYHNIISNLVDTESVFFESAGEEVFRYATTDEVVRTLGVEYELRREWRQGWMVSGQHSLQRTRLGSLSDGAALTNSPPHLLAAKGAVPVVSGVSRIANRLRFEAPRLTTQNNETEWAVIWDITFTGDIPGTGVEYGLGVRNALDWQYSHPGGFDLRQDTVPLPGRQFYASTHVRF